MNTLCLQYALTRAQRTSSLNTDDSWMYEDGHDEIAFSVDQPCQLLGIGLCGTEGAFTAEIELLEVTLTDTMEVLMPDLVRQKSLLVCRGSAMFMVSDGHGTGQRKDTFREAIFCIIVSASSGHVTNNRCHNRRSLLTCSKVQSCHTCVMTSCRHTAG